MGGLSSAVISGVPGVVVVVPMLVIGRVGIIALPSQVPERTMAVLVVRAGVIVLVLVAAVGVAVVAPLLQTAGSLASFMSVMHSPLSCSRSGAVQW
jgi:hypothetical protein